MPSFVKSLAAAILLLATTAATPLAAEKLKAVASFSIIGDMVARTGGGRIELTVIVGPDGDAHVYEPKPADAKAMAAADAVFVNGLGFEGWIGRLAAASGYAGPVAAVSGGVEGRGLFGEDGAPDPHAWQDAANAVIYVRNIAAALCAADAAGCGGYEANASAYVREIEALDAEIKAAVARVPAERRTVITSHDAFGYFARAYGITFLAPEGVSTDSEASAKDVAALIAQIRAEKASALFVENISDPRLIEQIAADTGLKIGGALYSDALSGPDGPAASYLGMMRHNAKLLTQAMAGS